ncbi:uncharacterized protein LOC128728359 [Anopheles nili]|uniref:uncharacterized protein LOC128728359 n=1 Tax=Anopheles nili TaxID=185578 RepID=UPI00237BEAD2|nr:uncharacterized protein LOC128728359 [Anopheles nili]
MTPEKKRRPVVIASSSKLSSGKKCEESPGKSNSSKAKSSHVLEVSNLNDDSKTDDQLPSSAEAAPVRQLRRKRRKLSLPSDDNEVIDETFEETIRLSAVKNNLTPACIKKLLKQIVVNDHVFAIVRLKEEEESRKLEKIKNTNTDTKDDEDEKEELQPKLTRLKRKQLKQTLLPIASLNEPTPDEEVTALIHKELGSDDDDDDEYTPADDEGVSEGDDDPNTTVSDIDSQPRTPASTTLPVGEQENDSEIHYTKDGLFKIPRARNDSQCSQSEQEQEIIALRTRSKLCLTTTAIETIESTFVPPDITNDMYECDVEMDQAWKDFLEEFTKPLPSILDEDDDNDPEYVAAEGIPYDPEEMRTSKVSKKELDELVLELMEMGGDEDQTLLEQTLTETINESLNCNDRMSMLNNSLLELENSDNPISMTPTTVQKCDAVQSTSKDPNVTVQLQTLQQYEAGHQSDMFALTNNVCQSTQNHLTPHEESTYQSATVAQQSTLETDSSDSRDPKFYIKYLTFEESPDDVFTYSNGNDRNVVPSYKLYHIQSTQVPVTVQLSNTDVGLNDFQFQLLHQQLRMHVQLTAQHFMQTYAHPKFWKFGKTTLDMLKELDRIGKVKPNIIPWNLPLALECCNSWVSELEEDNDSNKSLIKFWLDEVQHAEDAYKRERYYRGDFHWRVREKIINCKAFMYPTLIPYKAFRCDPGKRKVSFGKAEEHLITLWFEITFDKLKKEYENSAHRKRMQKPTMTTVCQYLSQHLCPMRSVKSLKNLAFRRKPSETMCKPVDFFSTHGYAPPFDHVLQVFDLNKVITLAQYKRGVLHCNWEQYIFSNKRITRLGLLKHTNEQETAVQCNFYQTSNLVENSGASVEYQLQVSVLLPDASAPFVQYVPVTLMTTDLTPQQQECISSDIVQMNSSAVGAVADYDLMVNSGNVNPTENTTSDALASQASSIIPSECTYIDQCNECVNEEKQNETAVSQNIPLEEYPSNTTDNSVLISANDSTPLSNLNKKPPSVIFVNRFRTAALATLYSILKKYLKDLRNECMRELTNALLLTQPAHPVFQVYAHFKQLQVYCLFLDDLQKMSSNFNVYYPRYNPVQQSHSQRATSLGLLRLSCSHRIDGSLVVRAEYITERFTNYHSMEDKDAMYAFNYYEKVEETLLGADRTDLLERFEQILKNFDEFEDRVSLLYYKIEELLGESFPQLVDMFLTFLLPGQAAEVGKFMEHFMLTNMTDFLEKLNIFFAKQPSQIKKVHACLNELSNEPNVTMDQVKLKVLPLLKGSTLLSEWFLQLFPSERPPDSLPSDYEHITMKKNPVSDTHDAETVQEHISYVETLQEVPENCCGSNTIRFIQGRIFQGALPARLTFLANNCVTKATDLPNIPEEMPSTGGESTLCDDATLMAHAIRLNPLVHCPKGIAYADVAHVLEDSIIKQNGDVVPEGSCIAGTSSQDECQLVTATTKKLPPKLPIKKRFNSPNSRKVTNSPGQEKLSPPVPGCSKDGALSKRSVVVSSDSKALVTARKLKLLTDEPQSGALQAKFRSPDEQCCPVEHECRTDSSQQVSEQLSSSNILPKPNDSEDKREMSEPPVESVSTQDPSWTRDEDKIILQNIIKGYTSVDTFVQQIQEKIPERNSKQIRNRFEFLQRMLRQVNTK